MNKPYAEQRTKHWFRAVSLEDAAKIRLKAAPVHLTPEQCWSLHRFLEHGEMKHREWLLHAIFAWSLGLPRPEEGK